MKQKIFLFIFIILFLIDIKSVNSADFLTEQKIEILKQEISVLQALVKNYNLHQEPIADSYIAVDISNNSVLLQKNINTQFSMASVTKLMTTVISLENIDMNKEIILTEEMLLPQGQTLVLYAGLKIIANDLLKATLIQSSNDSAEALSYFLGKEKFIDLMNKKAKELGMLDTTYYDAHGLSKNNKSTSLDLSKLMSYIYKNHLQVLEITKNNDFWLPDEKGRKLKFVNVNNFYYLGNFLGGKTGYTKEARQSFNSVFNVKGRPIAIVVLHSNNRIADIFSILRQLESKI